MSILFNHACRYEFFDRNPIRLVRQSAKRRAVPTVLLSGEIKVLIDNLALRERTLASKRYRGRRPYWGQAILRKYIRPAATLDVYTQAVTPAKHAAQAAVMSLVFSSEKDGGALVGG